MTDPSASPASVLSLIADDMAEVDARDRAAARFRRSAGRPGVALHHLAGGKRLRPALLLLVARRARASRARAASTWPRWSSSSTPPRCCTTTWSTSPTLRRGRATANESFGNPASVLVGDFLYSRAFQMMLAADMRVMEILADATNVIAEGEVLQLMNMHDPRPRRSGATCA